MLAIYCLLIKNSETLSTRPPLEMFFKTIIIIIIIYFIYLLIYLLFWC